MNDDILEAAVRVLVKQGPLKFTTVRVADEAGISVGSLYQYYPNKAALLLALHQRQMQQEWAAVQRVLDNETLTPRQRLTAVIDAFFSEEAQEAPYMRGLLEDAQAHIRDSREYRDLRVEADRRLATLLASALPARPPRELTFMAELFSTVIESLGATLAQRNLPRSEIARWSQACSDMLCRYAGVPTAPRRRLKGVTR